MLDKKNTGKSRETFNLGTGTGSSVLEVIESFERVSGPKTTFTKWSLEREGDVTEAYANTHKANALGWKAPECTLDGNG